MNEIRKEIRREVRRLRLGNDVRACVLCGEVDHDLLRRASRRLIEFHHLAGEANDPELGVFLCLTHHAWCTEAMRDAGVPLAHAESRSLLERLVAVLQGLAIFFQLAATLLTVWADQLAAFVGALDENHPEWRRLQDAS